MKDLLRLGDTDFVLEPDVSNKPAGWVVSALLKGEQRHTSDDWLRYLIDYDNNDDVTTKPIVGLPQAVYQVPVVIEHDADGYFANVPSLQGCHAQGDTLEEVMANIEDVIMLCIQDMAESGESLGPPATTFIKTVTVVMP